MKDTSGVEVMTRALNFLYNVKSPTPVIDFIKLELTGNDEADKFLAGISMAMLSFLKQNGFMESDDLNKNDAHIYGLTPDGFEMHRMFHQLTSGA